MPKNLRIKLNKKGVIALLTSREVTSDIASRSKAIADAAGEGFEASVTRNRDRAVGFVKTATFEAMREEATDRTLTRAIDAGR